MALHANADFLARRAALDAIGATPVVERLAVGAKRTADFNARLILVDADAVTGATDSTMACFVFKAIAIADATPDGADARARLVGLRARADLAGPTALAVAARDRRATLPAAHHRALAAVTAALAIDAGLVGPATMIVRWIARAPVADRAGVTAELGTWDMRRVRPARLAEALRAAVITARRSAGSPSAAPRNAGRAAGAAVGGVACQIAAELPTAVGPPLLATAAAVPATGSCTAIAVAAALGADFLAACLCPKGNPRPERGDRAAGSRQQ